MPLYRVNEVVNVLHEGVVRKGKILVIYPQKKNYLIQLEQSLLNDELETKIVLCPYYAIGTNTFDDKSFLKFISKFQHFQTSVKLNQMQKELSSVQSKKMKEEKKPKKHQKEE